MLEAPTNSIDLGAISEGSQGALAEIARLASVYFEIPIATVAICAGKKFRFEGTCGAGPEALAEEMTFCRHAYDELLDTFVVKDAARDSRFSGAGWISGTADFRFFAAAKLLGRNGETLGLLCLLDRRPRPFSDEQERMLALFGRQAASHLTLEQTLQNLQAKAYQLETSEARLDRAQRAAKIGTWEFDFRGNAIYWSSGTFRIFGIDPADGEPKYEDLLNLHTPESKSKLHSHVVAAIKAAGTYELELDILGPRGPARVLSTGETILDAGGLPKMLVGTIRVISDDF